MKNKNILVNGLLQHEVINSDEEQEYLEICKIYHNRDKNAVQNMISIIEELKKSGKRPLCFTRENIDVIKIHFRFTTVRKYLYFWKLN
jgi:hypothetical protein